MTRGEPGTGCDHLDVPAMKARVWFAWRPEGLAQLGFGALGCRAEQALSRTAGLEARGPLPEPYRDYFERYFAGEAVDPAALPVALEGTTFQLKVWTALRTIPRGRVMSYAAVASRIGQPRATRAVGAANGRNPIGIAVPCHRVVEADMQLGGYSGGLHIKRFLLELEGARLVGDAVRPGQLELV